jgi:hypothetical protein
MKPQQPPTLRRLAALLSAVVLLNILLVACAIPPEEPAAGEHAAMAAMTPAAGAAMSSHNHPMAPAADLPAELQTADTRTQEAYRFAIANRAAAEEVPCYCGCVGLGHVSSYDCYVAESAPGEALVVDLHAANCTVCVDITHDQMRLMDAGVTLELIRGYIDSHYAKYGPPTPLAEG